MNKKLNHLLLALFAIYGIFIIFNRHYSETKYANIINIIDILIRIGMITILWCNFFVSKFEKIDRNFYLVGACVFTFHAIFLYVMRWENFIIDNMDTIGLFCIALSMPTKAPSTGVAKQ